MEERDFIDFKFGDHWASEFNLVAVSSGDRYSPPVYGSVNPNTTTVAGKVGVYKWKSQIGEKVFNINIAFDNINGQTLNQIKEWLHPFKIDKLTFKEEPFKYYWVSLNNEPELNFVPFLEKTTIVNGIEFKEGVYKGEFNVQFICFDNYGYSDWQSFDENYDYLLETVNSTNGVIAVNDAMNVETEIGIQGVSRQETRAAEEGKTVEGEMISLSDVDNTKEHMFTIQGNSSQEIRSGKNLYNVKDRASALNDGISVDENDWITLTLDNSENNAISYVNYWTNNLNLAPNTNYSVICEIKEVSGTANFNIVSMHNGEGQSADTHDYQFSELSNNSIKKIIMTTRSDLTNTRYGLRTFISLAANASLASVTFRLSVLEDTTITTDTFKYEAYGAMPSLEYPSEIKSTGDNINLFDKDNANTENGYFTNAVFSPQSTFIKTLYIECEPNTTYTISKVLSSRFAVGTSEVIPASGTSITNFVQTNNATKLSITSGNNDNYLYVFYYHANYDTLTEQEILDSIKIEEGPEATGYTPYQKGGIAINYCNKNKFSCRESYTKDGITLTKHDDGSFSLEGTATITTTFSIATYFKIKGTNTCSLEIIEGSIPVVWFWNKQAGQSHINLSESKTIQTITYSEEQEIACAITINQGVTYSVTAKIQIEEGTTKTDYESHQSQSYPIYLDRELYGDETVKDTIVKRVGKWYYKLNWAKYVFTGEETVSTLDNGTKLAMSSKSVLDLKNVKIKTLDYAGNLSNAYSNCFKIVTQGEVAASENYMAVSQWGEDKYLYFSATDRTIETFKALLAEQYTNGTPVYIIYELVEPIYEEITDEILIGQLNALENSTLYQNITNIIGNDNVKLHYNYLTPIPSIKIPSEIQNTEEKIDIQICNKNLIPFGYDKGYTFSTYGITIEILDKHRVKINGTATNNFSYNLLGNNNIYYKKDNFYTLSCKKVSGSFSDYLLVHTSFKNNTVDNWNLQSINLKNEKPSTTIKITEDGYSPRLIIYALAGFSFDNLIIEIQLEQGKTTTEYVDPQSQTITFPLSEGQKLYKGSYLAEDGIHNIRGQYIFKGTESFIKSPSYTTDTSFCCYTSQISPAPKINGNSGLCTIGPIAHSGYTRNYTSGFFYNTNISHFLKIENDAIPNWDNNLTDSKKIELFKSFLAQQYANNTPIMIEYELEKEEIIPYTQEQEEALKNIYLYTGINNIYVDNAELALTYIPQQNIYIDYMVNCSNLLNDSSFYHENNIYKKSYFDIDTGDATTSGISTDRPVYLYNAGTSRANLNLTFDLIIPAEDSPLIIKTESCKLTDDGIQILNEESLISISNFSNFKPFLDIYDGNLDNWQIEIDSELCEVYVKHKTDKTKIISLNKFNDEQSFLSLANCKFVDYLKPFPTSITAISNSAIENTIFNKLSVASSAQDYRLKNVYVDWKHTYI
ncbi:MAG: phage tail family protein [Alphaproteobacteria bacterium]|nr:phage tail family protein [Alphaproteobacteria bacterium]